MTTQPENRGRDLHARYLAKVNTLIADDREDLVAEVVAEYGELTAADERRAGTTAA